MSTCLTAVLLAASPVAVAAVSYAAISLIMVSSAAFSSAFSAVASMVTFTFTVILLAAQKPTAEENVYLHTLQKSIDLFLIAESIIVLEAVLLLVNGGRRRRLHLLHGHRLNIILLYELKNFST